MRKIIKICMLGAGRVGKLHSRSINQSMGQAEVVAIVDPVESVRQCHSRMILGLICVLRPLKKPSMAVILMQW